ncbi:MAG: hypothetical protein IPP36_13125 [Nitrosomonadales bacterium]|nr:hypothetical protein [Nitrosomonadales bacterium]
MPSSVLSGSSSVCTATPSTGYYFTGWTGACAAASTNLTCNLNNVTANQSSVATFALLSYTVVATAGTGGRVVPLLFSWVRGYRHAKSGYYFSDGRVHARQQSSDL